jgi:hypothetical protein
MDWIHLAQDIDKFALSFEHGSKKSRTIKGGEFFDWLRNC